MAQASPPGPSRAGNAMARTRVAVLLGARQCLVAVGSKTTMVDIAARSGVAKATLYNHFRTKSEVFAALVEHEIREAAAETAELVEVTGLPTALARLAERLGEHPVVRRLAATEPGVLSGVLLPEQAGLGEMSWETARSALASLLGAEADVELVLRYLVSQLLWPAPRVEIERAVGTLLAAVAPSDVAARPAPAAVPVVSAGGATAPGLGFPVSTHILERVPLR